MTKKFQLKNGMQVVFVESHKSPVVSVQMWVRTGSVDEQKGEEGISHFIEHLVFKGTEKFGVGEIASTVEGSGGELNAYTSFDQTVFYVTISSQFFETGLKVISEMMGFPQFDPQEIENEREVVVEEIKRGQDSLGRVAGQNLFQTAFKKSAYRIPVIGYEKNVRSWSPQKIRKFFESRYTPPNMFLVVTGDFEAKSAKEKVQGYFGKFKKTPLKKVARKKEPKQTTPRVSVHSTVFQQSIGYGSWKIPGAGHKDIPALDVAAFILGQGDSSRLTRRLRIEEPLVNSIGTGNYLPLEGGLFMLSFGFEKQKFARITEAIRSEFQKFLEEGPSEEEVRKAILNLESGELYSIETVDGLARRYGSVEFQFRDLKAFDRYFKTLRTLKASDIQKVAQKYLSPNSFSLAITSQGDCKDLENQAQAWVRQMKLDAKKKKTIRASKKDLKIKALKMKPGLGKTPQVEVIQLQNGSRLLLRPSQETAVISVRAAMLGGMRFEPKGQNGLVELFSRSWMGGTKSKTETELFEQIDQIAASLSPIAGRNSVALSLDALANYEKQGAELFLDVLFQSEFPATVVEREKELQLQQMKHKKDNPSQIVFNLFLKKMFEGHPYANEQLGREEELKPLQSKDLLNYWSQIHDPKAWHFVACGQVNRDFWVEKLNSTLAKAEALKKNQPRLTLAELKKSATLFEKAEKEQTHLVYGFRSLAMKDPRRHILQLIQSVLAGQGGRLFIELRDKESLAYSVAPTRLEGLEGGYFGAYIGCSPEKSKKAVQMMKVEFEKLCDHLLTHEELERAKRYMIGRHDIELQRTSSIASGILFEDLYGLDFNEVFHYADVVDSITASQVRDLANEIFKGPAVLAAVGPREIDFAI